MDDDSDPDSGIPAERPHGWAVQYHNRTVYDAQKAFARRMRSAPTPAEDALWQAIRYKRMDGYKFRRQHAIERYIADFYCAEARLVIEVDGEIHLGQQAQDAERDACFQALGLTVLRFSNDQVLHNLAEVLSRIRGTLSHA